MKFKNNTSLITLATLLSLLLFSCRGMFFNPLTTYQKNISLQPYDAIIIPGVEFEDSTWSTTMKNRVLWSVYLYEHGFAKNIIYSGSAVYTPYIEGKIMAMYAMKLGVRPENIFIESKAEHSTENVYYGCLIAKKMGFEKVGLATDRFQSRTLSDFLPKMKRKVHVDVKSLPIQDDLLSTMPQNDPVIDYNTAHVDTFVSIIDRESKIKRFWGTLGKNINYAESDTLEPISKKAGPSAE